MKKRYWLRGGIIGLAIIVLNILVIGPFGPLGFLFILPRSLAESFYIVSYPSHSALLISYFFAGFIYGSIIGWLYGKIKKRNNKI